MPIRFELPIEVSDPALHAKVDDLKTLLQAVLTQGDSLMAANAENHALLDAIVASLDQLATSEEAQTAAITEIGTDLDELIAITTDTTLRDRLQALKDKATAAAASSTAQTEALQGLAAKHPAPPAA